MRSDAMPSFDSSLQSPMWPSLSEFHCAITTTARRRGVVPGLGLRMGLAGK